MPDLELHRENLSDSPIEQFSRWFQEAVVKADVETCQAMCLSTLDPDGWPEGRMILVKEWDDRGFVFYTNTLSPKGKSLEKTPRVCMTFFWPPQARQVRVQGPVALVSPEEADAYFQSRPRGSQIGAWASQQSQPLDSRETLEKKVNELTRKYQGQTIPRPPYWSGYRLAPQRIEFWQGRLSRLHDRFIYERKDGGWTITRLYP